MFIALKPKNDLLRREERKAVAVYHSSSFRSSEGSSLQSINMSSYSEVPPRTAAEDHRDEAAAIGIDKSAKNELCFVRFVHFNAEAIFRCRFSRITSTPLLNPHVL